MAAKAVLAGLITGGLIVAATTPAHARTRAARATLAARPATAAVTAGDPTSVRLQLRPAAVTRLQVQERVAGRWVARTSAVTSSRGAAVARLSPATAGVHTYRAITLRTTGRAASPTFAVTVAPAGSACAPTTPLVDDQATPAARCLAARLDRWRKAGVMGVGQQLNVSNISYRQPLDTLGGRRVSVVGFDLQELADGQTYQFPTAPLDALGQLAQQGAVLSATWHAHNPRNGVANSFQDDPWHDLGPLLDPSTPEYSTFWVDFDAKMALLKQLQDQYGVAVVFRPFHEVNGDWFWWGRPDPTTFRKVWKAMQERAAVDGVHNVLWAYSFNADTGPRTVKPVSLLPPVSRVDLAGIDSYGSPATAKQPATLPMTGYAAVAALVTRMTITEAGPYNSTTGRWNPEVITAAARAQSSKPLWSMLWFDDGSGKKQISSLGPNGSWGKAWLDSCPQGFCSLF